MGQKERVRARERAEKMFQNIQNFSAQKIKKNTLNIEEEEQQKQTH